MCRGNPLCGKPGYHRGPCVALTYGASVGSAIAAWQPNDVPDDERKTERPPAKAPASLTFNKMGRALGASVGCRCGKVIAFDKTSSWSDDEVPGQDGAVGYARFAHCEACNIVHIGALARPANIGEVSVALRREREAGRLTTAGELTSLRDVLGDRDHTIAEQQREIGRLTMALAKAERKAAKR